MRTQSTLVGLALAVVLHGATGCERTAPPPQAATTPLPVEVVGCAAVRTGPLCVLPADATLTVAPAAGEGPLVILPVAFASEAPSPGGPIRYRVRVPSEVSRVEVRRGEAVFSLPVAPPATSSSAAEALYGAGQQARREGRPEAALSSLEAAAARAEADGEVSVAARSRMLGAFVALELRRFEVARSLLGAVRPLGPLWPEGEALRLYHEALVARETGDLRTALRAFDEARGVTERLALPLGRVVAQETATVWLRLGRSSEAYARFEALAAEFGDSAPCERADARLNAAWVVLFERARNRGAFPGLNVAPLLDAALEAYLSTCRDTPTRPASVRVNLALDALSAGRLDAARTHLDAAAKGPEDAEIAVWRRHAEGRLALAEGRTADALALAERLAREAFSISATELAWRAAVDAGVALEALGRREDAAQWYRQAEDLLDDHATRVPVDQGRVRLLADFGESARRRIGIERALGRPQAALDALRIARRRALSRLATPDPAHLEPARRAAWTRAYAEYAKARAALDLEAGEDWRRTDAELAALTRQREGARRALRVKLDTAVALLDTRADSPEASSLPPLPVGSATLAWGDSPAGRIVFCVHGEQVSVHDLPDASPAARLAASLSACAHVLARTTEVRILPDPSLEGLDLHAVEFEGRIFIAGRVVRYAVDLLPPSKDGSGASQRALVVADALGDLPSARVEGARIERRLQALGWRTVEALVDRAASVDAVLTGLRSSNFMHYAGHGEYAGSEGWESGLPVAFGRRVKVADLLSQPAVPRHVVLSGCEMARAEGQGSVSGLGLAQALVLGGAHEVVAATRPVADADAARVMEALYAQLGPGSPELAAALARAQTALAASGSPVDWAAFRAVTP